MDAEAFSLLHPSGLKEVRRYQSENENIQSCQQDEVEKTRGGMMWREEDWIIYSSKGLWRVGGIGAGRS